MEILLGKKIHPFVNLFPKMNSKEYETLKEGIRRNGQIEPIMLHEDQVIDGYHRLRVCKELELEPKYAELDRQASILDYVISKNLQRRHLNSGQRATIAVVIEKHLAEKAKERQGNRNDLKTNIPEKIPESRNAGESAEQAARLTGTNSRYVRDAKKLEKKNSGLFLDVSNGKLKLPQAMVRAGLTKPKQTAKKESSFFKSVKKKAKPKVSATEPTINDKYENLSHMMREMEQSLPNSDNNSLESGLEFRNKAFVKYGIRLRDKLIRLFPEDANETNTTVIDQEK